LTPSQTLSCFQVVFTLQRVFTTKHSNTQKERIELIRPFSFSYINIDRLSPKGLAH
jgi:hypothetical protein